MFSLDDGIVSARASWAGCLEFKSRADQILHSVANSSTTLQHLRKLLLLLSWSMLRQ